MRRWPLAAVVAATWFAACACRQPAPLGQPAAANDAGTIGAGAMVMVQIPVADDAPTDKPVLIAVPAIPSSAYPPPDSGRALSGCAGFFPAEADSDVGLVLALVTVEPSGAPSTVSIVEIKPPSEKSFGKAARSRLLLASFRPAIGPDGSPTRGTAAVKVRFAR